MKSFLPDIIHFFPSRTDFTNGGLSEVAPHFYYLETGSCGCHSRIENTVAKKLTNPFEVLWKSFSLVFFAEWGDRSMLATIALGAAQSPWGVAGGAIAGHLVATSIAIVGGSFLANYISEKLVGYLGGVLFLIFAAATLLGVF